MELEDFIYKNEQGQIGCFKCHKLFKKGDVAYAIFPNEELKTVCKDCREPGWISQFVYAGGE